MAFIVRILRRNGLIQSCTNIEAINMNPPAVITRQYEDQCGCRTCCSYPNSVWAVLPVQFVTTIALGLSIASIADCRLVRVPNTLENGIDKFTIQEFYNRTIPVGIKNNNATSRSIGLFGWENINGECSFDSYEDMPGNDDRTAEHFPTVKLFLELVGRDFIPLMKLGVAVTILGFLVLIWMLCLLSCVAHTRRYRGFFAAILIFLLPLLQLLTLRILGTEFCEDRNCKLDEGSFFVISAAILYFAAGLLLCMGTQDFPGNPYNKRKQGTILTNMRSCCRRRSETISQSESVDNNDKNQLCNGSPTTDVEMTNYNNGFADAVEIPVESEYIDRTLIEQDEIRLNTTSATIVLADSINLTNTPGMNDSNSIAIMSPEFAKSNV